MPSNRRLGTPIAAQIAARDSASRRATRSPSQGARRQVAVAGRIGVLATLVITMGCGESCPVVIGQEREDWPVADPKGRPYGEVKEISRAIRSKVEDLLDRRGWRVTT